MCSTTTMNRMKRLRGALAHLMDFYINSVKSHRNTVVVAWQFFALWFWLICHLILDNICLLFTDLVVVGPPSLVPEVVFSNWCLLGLKLWDVWHRRQHRFVTLSLWKPFYWTVECQALSWYDLWEAPLVSWEEPRVDEMLLLGKSYWKKLPEMFEESMGF